MSALRVLHVDDHAVVLGGVASALKTSDGVEIAGATEVGDVDEVLARVEPDVVLLDLFLGADPTWHLCREFTSRGVPVVFFSGYGNRQLIEEAMRCGAAGYVLKTAELGDFPQQLERVRDGGQWWNAELLGEWNQQRQRTGEAEFFSEQELEIVVEIARGRDNLQIAEAIGVSVHTVKFHIAKALRRTGEVNRAGLVRRASEAHLIPRFWND